MFENYDIFKRDRLTLHCLFTTLSTLSHIEDVSGNVSNPRTMKILGLDDQVRPCFAVSGNALRGGLLRRVWVKSALTTLGIDVNPDVHHTMFAGGRIDASTANDMDLDQKIRRLIPWLSVLGTAKPAKVFGSKDSQMVQGRIEVGSAFLICYESAELIYRQMPSCIHPDAQQLLQEFLAAKDALSADRFSPTPLEVVERWRQMKLTHLPQIRTILKTYPQFIDEQQTTRRDSLLDPNLLRFLPPKLQLELQGTGGSGEKKKSDQMIASDRLIMPGAQLYSRWDANMTEVEEGGIYNTLREFAIHPYLGGKGNRGNGLVSLEVWFESGEEKGHLFSTNKVESDRFVRKLQRYEEYMQRYQEYLANLQGSAELRNMLGSS